MFRFGWSEEGFRLDGAVDWEGNRVGESGSSVRFVGVVASTMSSWEGVGGGGRLVAGGDDTLADDEEDGADDEDNEPVNKKKNKKQ